MAVAADAPDDLGISDLLLVFLVVFLPAFLAALFAYLWLRSAREAKAAQQDASAVRERFSGVVDADAEEKRVCAETARTRINVTTAREEFFRATIDEVEHAVRRLAPEAPFINDVEAQEFRETQKRRLAALNASTASAREAFPSAI